jgi:hypothetical protein
MSMVPGCSLFDLVRRVLDSCWPLGATSPASYTPPSHFFRASVVLHPIPFFGNLESAEVLTIGVNPSSTEFEPWRDWPEQRMTSEDLSNRLLDYFRRPHPKPHPWFADIEEALACCPEARLVIFVGNVLDRSNPRGIELGEFLAAHRPNLWKRTLEGRRWPKLPCPKSQLAKRVFTCRADLKKHLAKAKRKP